MQVKMLGFPWSVGWNNSTNLIERQQVHRTCLLETPANSKSPKLQLRTFSLAIFSQNQMLSLPEGPKLATRGGVNGSRSKFLPKSETSAYVPKSPQALEPRSARIAMDKLSRSRRPGSQRGSKSERNFSNRSTTHTDRSDQSGWRFKKPDRSDRFRRPVRPVSSRQPETKASKGKS